MLNLFGHYVCVTVVISLPKTLGKHYEITSLMRWYCKVLGPMNMILVNKIVEVHSEIAN